MAFAKLNSFRRHAYLSLFNLLNTFHEISAKLMSYIKYDFNLLYGDDKSCSPLTRAELELTELSAIGRFRNQRLYFQLVMKIRLKTELLN